MKFSDLISGEDKIIADQQVRVTEIIKRSVIKRAKKGNKSARTKEMRERLRKEAKRLVVRSLRHGMRWLNE